MSSFRRWTAGAAMSGVLLLGLQMGPVPGQQPGQAQQPAQQQPPQDGKALAAAIGLSGDAAARLGPQLDRLAAALTQQARLRDQATKARTDLHGALAAVAPTLTPEQRQQVMGVIVRSGGFGPGMGHAARGAGYGMRDMGYGPGGQGMPMGPGMRGQGYGPMGPGVQGRGYGPMGPGMRGQGYGRMGPGMRGQGYGPGGSCPFYPAQPDSGSAQPGGGSDGPAGR
jgi:hypothetical protein